MSKLSLGIQSAGDEIRALPMLPDPSAATVVSPEEWTRQLIALRTYHPLAERAD